MKWSCATRYLKWFNPPTKPCFELESIRYIMIAIKTKCTSQLWFLPRFSSRFVLGKIGNPDGTKHLLY